MHGNPLFFVQESRQERPWSRDVDVHPHLAHPLYIGTRHAAVQDIAKDCDLEPREFSCIFFDRIEIEEPLRRVCMCSVSRIDDNR